MFVAAAALGRKTVAQLRVGLSPLVQEAQLWQAWKAAASKFHKGNHNVALVRQGGFFQMRQLASKIPTQIDFMAFDGAHCSVLWRGVSDGWMCPCCIRSKFELLRWTMRFPKLPQRFQGWMAELHKHHDHSVDVYSHDELTFAVPRFETTLICGQCNAADGHAKRVLGLPSAFSFSPAEISSFVTAKPHSKHEINYAMAQLIFDDIHEQENQNFLAQGYEFSTC